MERTLQDSGSKALKLGRPNAPTALARRAATYLLWGLGACATVASLSACAPYSSQFAYNDGSPAHYVDQGPNATYPLVTPQIHHLHVADNVAKPQMDRDHDISALDVGATAKPEHLEAALGI